MDGGVWAKGDAAHEGRGPGLLPSIPPWGSSVGQLLSAPSRTPQVAARGLPVPARGARAVPSTAQGSSPPQLLPS